MHQTLRVDPDSPVHVRIAQIHAELSMQLGALELRMIKAAFICMIFTVPLLALLLLPTLRGPALVLVLGGSAGQAYAVWRM
jgi:hypothetical protein